MIYYYESPETLLTGEVKKDLGDRLLIQETQSLLNVLNPELKLKLREVPKGGIEGLRLVFGAIGE